MKGVIGAVTVMACCFILGKKVTEKEKNSILMLDEIILLFGCIQSGISSSLLPLPEIYESFSCKSSAGKEFEYTLKSQGLQKALETVSLPPCAEDIIFETASTLGRLDSSTQCERLGRAVERLSELRDTCKAETAGRTKSIEAIFSLAGALAIILMF